MSFSERMNYVPQKQIQINDIDSATRHRIINMAEELFDDEQAKYVLDALGCRTMRGSAFPVSKYRGRNFDKLIQLLETLPWHNLYDVIEYGYGFLKKNCDNCTSDCDAIYDENDGEYYSCEYKNDMDEYSEAFNSVFEQEKTGYRLIEGIISPIIGETEMECIEEASNTKFHPVNLHLQKALQLYSDRKNPDYENSVKESISAVEAVCCAITGMTGSQATLGNTLKHLDKNGLVIHQALRTAFEKMYGYASDADGIRHGGIDFRNAPAEDAKYMLISCAAFVNYLIEKYSRIGGTT